MQRVLERKKIVITRSIEKSEEAANLLEENGAEIIAVPTNKIVPVKDSGIQTLAESISAFDYLIFTSANSVEYFLKEAGVVDLTNLQIAVVGMKTAEFCLSSGINVDIIPEKFSAAGLIEKLKSIGLNGKKVLIPGSALSRDELKNGLKDLGAEVIFIPVYDVVPASKNDFDITEDKIKEADIFIFTSPSTFKNFIKIFELKNIREYFNQKTIAVIGPTTEAALQEHGLKSQIIPAEFTMLGLAKEIIKYFEEN